MVAVKLKIKDIRRSPFILIKDHSGDCKALRDFAKNKLEHPWDLTDLSYEALSYINKETGVLMSLSELDRNYIGDYDMVIVAPCKSLSCNGQCLVNIDFIYRKFSETQNGFEKALDIYNNIKTKKQERE